MQQVDINEFMRQFHAAEHRHGLFGELIDARPWWDTVRYNVACYLFECLSESSYAAANAPVGRANPLGRARRYLLRQQLLARVRRRPGAVLAIRAPRALSRGSSVDTIIDPLLATVPAPVLTIDTLPRRYHLPDLAARAGEGMQPAAIAEIVVTLLADFGVKRAAATALWRIIRRSRDEFQAQVTGYHRLFDAAQPRMVLVLQNGIDKGLFRVARERGVPTIEAQHGVVGFGHPQYSYSPGHDYRGCTEMPNLFATFADHWQHAGHYPAGRQLTVGTAAFEASTAAPPPAGAVMVCSANIYHRDLLTLTRAAAAALPNRRFLYKLHPNQRNDHAAIAAELASLPNVDIAPADIPAHAMMDDVSHLVAVQSTVVYQALQMGRSVAIVPRLDFGIHADVLADERVAVTATAAELEAALRTPPRPGAAPIFFAPFDSARARDAIASMLAAG